MFPSTDLIMYFNHLNVFVVLKRGEHILLLYSPFDDGILSAAFANGKYLLL